MTLRPPDGLWSVKGTLLVLSALLGPTLASVALVHNGDFAATLAAARTILVACGGLIAAGLLIGHARLAGNDQSLWLASALGITATAGLARGGYRLTHPSEIGLQTATMLVWVIGVNVVLVVMLLCARHWGSRLNPLVVGVPLAVALLVAQQLVITGGPRFDSRLVPVLTVLLCLTLLGFAATVQSLDALPHWVRNRISLAVALGVVSKVLLLTSLPVSANLLAIVAVALGLADAVLLASTAAALMREVMTDGQRQLSDLQRRLAAAEENRRADSARLHDINSLVAGIASASRLIRELPPSDHRTGLEVLVLAELDRLQRLLADRHERAGRAGKPRRAGRRTSSLGTFDVGEVAGRIALAHRARGRGVEWDVADAQVAGDPDDLAQLLDILIDNAAQHGTPDDITLRVRRVGAQVEIAVADRGPGVAPELRQSLFAWGARGPHSDGSGIGLASASVLATELGGRLELDLSSPGARMVLTVPQHSATFVPEDLAVAAH